ncbi:MAG: AtpZ/AtpI family protein [Oscillospiraceae bacterium]|nr:AtpZ/AtpI family protein [Oscillospiraceae bacterium]
MSKSEDKKHNRELLRSLYMISQMGVTIAACVIIGVLLGRFLDGLLGTSPFLLIAFSLIGAGAGFRAIFQLANKDKR